MARIAMIAILTSLLDFLATYPAYDRPSIPDKDGHDGVYQHAILPTPKSAVVWILNAEPGLDRREAIVHTSWHSS